MAQVDATVVSAVYRVGGTGDECGVGDEGAVPGYLYRGDQLLGASDSVRDHRNVEWKQKPESTSGRHRCLNIRCRYEDLDGACRTPLPSDIVTS